MAFRAGRTKNVRSILARTSVGILLLAVFTVVGLRTQVLGDDSWFGNHAATDEGRVGEATLPTTDESTPGESSSEALLAISPILPGMSKAEAAQASLGCVDCHTKTDAPSMHENPAVVIGCASCHGGNPAVRATTFVEKSPEWMEAKARAHVLPRHPEFWPTAGNPKGSYANLNKESPEFIKFFNPGDLRVAAETCGGCHAKITSATKRSLMTTSAMLWGGASYNNGILPYKKYILGESYTRASEPASLVAELPITAERRAKGALDKLIPLPTWEVLPPADVFRVFERGGFFIKSQFAEIGLPNPLEETGRPDIRQSNRGPGTGSRVAIPVLNIHKTRLNDPHLSFLGTNEHPGDYRSSGCTACHAVYANDRDPRHSGPWAKYGHLGQTQTVDPTISKEEEGHPIKHVFTRAIPTSSCMVCHMHQPNMFMNTYLGYTMWDYESDAPSMWPEKQKYPTDEEKFETLSHNPEEASIRGKWGDIEFLRQVWDMNPTLKSTQFADYHGHGWNFRAIYSKDRKGHLLDKQGKVVDFNDPKKFEKAVHMSDIHVDYGMHCTDCHFGQDAHGDGHIYGEVMQPIEIMCENCHGDVDGYTNLKTTGPAAPAGGHDLSLMRTPYGDKRFEWRDGSLYQRSQLTKGLEWRVSQVRDSVDPKSSHYNEKAARAKTVERFKGDEKLPKWGDLKAIDTSKDLGKLLAHSSKKMLCYTCHTSWTTTCAGCHLPIQANWKTETKHYEGKTTRNWATYNPQVARDEAFQIGLHGPTKDGKIAPVRSSSALILSSIDINRQIIYYQQPPVSSAGFSSQAFAPHFPHTVRKTETKGCQDCHVSEQNDNNAIMAQLTLQGTNFLNFMGYFVHIAAGGEGVEAVQVTEYDEPQAVIGSYLHRYAYPDYYKKHQESGMELQVGHRHHGTGGESNCIQMRGEYLYVAEGSAGFRAYDIASLANKGFSERIISGPFSPLGHDTHIASKNATCFALATTMPVASWKRPFAGDLEKENMEQPLHPIYRYAFITDAEEGLIVTDIDSLSNGEPRDNFFTRALTWNENGILTGARTIQLAGATAYIGTESALVALDLEKPLEPRVIKVLPFEKVTGIAVQFRYLFLTDARGLHVVDVTFPDKMHEVESAFLPLDDARNVYVARTYAYVSGGKNGLIIVDVEKPEHPVIYQSYNENGEINDLNDVKIASTNASLFGYLADGKNGLRVIQLTDPERVPGYYGFSPEVQPKLIAKYQTAGPAKAISKPLDRDRAVDETGHQVSILGRLGSRPFNGDEVRSLFIRRREGSIFTVPQW